MDIKTLAANKNWEIGTTPIVLEEIHREEINIAIYERNVSPFTHEINNLLDRNIEIRLSGDVDVIMKELTRAFYPNKYNQILQDIRTLLLQFKKVVKGEKFRLLLATVNTNMCRKFHTDINDVRLLCTYSGPGTLWLTDDNINKKALEVYGDNESIVIDENRIQQAKTGSVVLLKGAIYPQENTKAIVHRSPTIEESGEKRLLLRIDTNENLKLWT